MGISFTYNTVHPFESIFQLYINSYNHSSKTCINSIWWYFAYIYTLC